MVNQLLTPTQGLGSGTHDGQCGWQIERPTNREVIAEEGKGQRFESETSGHQSNTLVTKQQLYLPEQRVSAHFSLILILLWDSDDCIENGCREWEKAKGEVTVLGVWM